MTARRRLFEAKSEFYGVYALACLELGLRWLNDRAAERRALLRKHEQDDPAGKFYG